MPEKFYTLRDVETNAIHYVTYAELEDWISPDKDVFFYAITWSAFDEFANLSLDRLRSNYGLESITNATVIDYMQSQINKGAQAGHDFYRYDLTGDPEHPVCVISGSLKDMADWILDDYSVHEIPAADYYAYFKSNP